MTKRTIVVKMTALGVAATGFLFAAMAAFKHS